MHLAQFDIPITGPAPRWNPAARRDSVGEENLRLRRLVAAWRFAALLLVAALTVLLLFTLIVLKASINP